LQFKEEDNVKNINKLKDLLFNIMQVI